MTLWWKVRALPVPAVGLVLFAVLAAVVGNASAELPSLYGATAQPLLLFAPLVLTLALSHCLHRRLPSAEATGVRAGAWWDRVLALSVAGLGCGAVVLLPVASGGPDQDAAGRNTLFLVGLLLVVRRVAGELAGAVAPVAWVLAMTLIGSAGPGRTYVWSVVLLPGGHRGALVVSVGLLLVGIAVLPRGAPNRGGWGR
ncbi:hypothetical protein [Streptomyces sp. BBFR102]|uniref:hypothetical protein n=1 Tax=Streptomyces sp. BBFR102 TaxID=3448171 RepID=UPI003F52CF76